MTYTIVDTKNPRGRPATDAEIIEIETRNQEWLDTKNDRLLKELREQRNKLLAETDWAVLSDTPIENKTEILTYRQALRDMPETTLDLENPVWPEKVI